MQCHTVAKIIITPNFWFYSVCGVLTFGDEIVLEFILIEHSDVWFKFHVCKALINIVLFYQLAYTKWMVSVSFKCSNIACDAKTRSS